IFAHSLEPASGPGLVFMTLPLAFGSMTAGGILGALFFLLLAFAALTSSISMLEAPVSWLHDHRGWQRKHAAIAVGALVWLLGLLCVFSFNIFAGVYPLASIGYFAGMTFFDLFDFATTRIMVPLIGACIALFVGWALTKHLTADELGVDSSAISYGLWRFSVRFLAPTVLALLCYSLLTSK
ncbi:MAG: sodium-dependent transporter, partial [Pseudomonadales bacterium]